MASGGSDVDASWSLIRTPNRESLASGNRRMAVPIFSFTEVAKNDAAGPRGSTMSFEFGHLSVACIVSSEIVEAPFTGRTPGESVFYG